MFLARLSLTMISLANFLPQAASAQEKPADAGTAAADKTDARRGNSDIIVTAVARGRDRLDSAISTSSLHETEILKIAPRSTAEIFRNIPGIR